MTATITQPRSQRTTNTSRMGRAAFIIVIAAAGLYLLWNAIELLANLNIPDGDNGASLIETGVNLFVPGVLGIIFGHIGAHQERRRGWKSRLTLTGLIGGYILTVYSVISAVVIAIYLLLGVGLILLIGALLGGG